MVDGYRTADSYLLRYHPEPPSWIVVALTTVGACMLSAVLISAALPPGPFAIFAQVVTCGFVLLGAAWVVAREARVNTARTVWFFRDGPVRIEEERKSTGVIVREVPYDDIVEVRLWSHTHKGVQSELLMLICRSRSAIQMAQTVGTKQSTSQLWLLADDLRGWISEVNTHRSRGGRVVSAARPVQVGPHTELSAPLTYPGRRGHPG